MNSLGVYFGSKVISIVEAKSSRVLNNVRISRLALAAAGDTEAKVPEEVKIVALFKDELRKNRIETKEVNLCLSGRDLIIRTFEMPVLPAKEFKNAVNFEAKKYLPFKLEELFSSYQVILDKPNKRNIVLYVSVRKDALEKYLSILEQLGLEAVTLEYSGFSVLRLLRLNRFAYKDIVALISTDFQEEDEINFTVLENGFPLFSRDMALSISAEAPAALKAGDRPAGVVSEKLKTEIRVSLDYFHRKFPAKNISKIFFIINKEYIPELEAFAKDLGLGAQFIELEPYVGKSMPFSASFIKAYSSSLAKTINIPIKADLIGAREDALRELKLAEGLSLALILKGLEASPRAVAAGILICASAFGLGFYQRAPVQHELKSIIAMRPKISNVDISASFDQLSGISAKYKQKFKLLNDLVKNQFYFTRILSAIPGFMPEGAWLTSFSFSNAQDKQVNKLEIRLEGLVYSSDKSREFGLVNTLAASLKSDETFSKYFSDVNILSLSSGPLGSTTVTTFQVECRGSYKDR